MVEYHATDLHGVQVASVPQVCQELLVWRGDWFSNVGQVISCAMEDGSGTGFNVRTTKVEGEFYVKLANEALAIGLSKVQVLAN